MLGFIDYLVYLFGTGDASYRDLYIGEKLKQCYQAGSPPEEVHSAQRQITSSDRRVLVTG